MLVNKIFKHKRSIKGKAPNFLSALEISDLCSFRDLVHVLRFNDSFQVIFQDLGEIIL